MFADGFKTRYTTIPFAVYKNRNSNISNLYSHCHKEVELITVVEGAIDFYIGSDSYEVRAGEVLVIPPYCVHRSTLQPGTYHECICFDLSILWGDPLLLELESGALTVKSHLSSHFSYTPLAYNCTRGAFAAYEKKLPGWELEVIGNLSVLFSVLKENDFFHKTDVQNTEHTFGRRAHEYIISHYTDQITSSTAAEALYLNNSYFCRLFKKTFGSPFSEYLLGYRIDKAKLELNTGDDSISDIAIKNGFNSFSYFSKSFKSRVGITPSAYRKRKRKTN